MTVSYNNVDMQRYFSKRLLYVCAISVVFAGIAFLMLPQVFAGARNVHTYSDLISTSNPGGDANHTFTFELKEAIAAGGYLDFDFPSGFELPATTTFGVRNVELYVDGIPRTATGTPSATNDGVVITTGDGGSVRYTLNSSTGIPADSDIEFRIGNHTSNTIQPSLQYSTSTGTTTVPGDPVPITNTTTLGNHEIVMTAGGTAETVYADFVIVIIPTVSIAGVDTTEEIPPYRFNGSPEGEIGGTTLYVELSLETDEFAWCRFGQTPGVAFTSMTSEFDDTGLIVHTHLVAVVKNALNTYYIRCIDDEGNYNTDDFEIAFYAPDDPAGTANTEGGTEGDGTGAGDSGTGDGAGSGGTTGEQDGGADTVGGSSGGGGSGGGSGGSSGPDDEGDVGGGLETSDGPYPSGDATVIINGYAFPGSTVYALVDGTIAESSRASSDGKYSITLEEISRGVYTFGVYAIDDDDTKSSTFSTSFTVTGGKTSSLSNINIMPSILVEPDPVDVGATLTISGYSIPDAAITIENQRDGTSASLKTFTTTSDGDGAWSIEVDTNGFSAGTYKVRAKAEGESVETDYSDFTYYGVGQDANRPLNADLNRDGSVNLTDFSILLFWWGSDGGTSDPPADINQDGSVSLTDFSILLFQWTG